MDILVLCPSLPRADTAAGDLRFMELLGMLGAAHTVDLAIRDQAPISETVDGRYLQQLKQAGVKFLGEFSTRLSEILARRRYDLVIFEFWHTSTWALGVIRRWQPWAKILIDTVDVHFAREEAGVALGVLDQKEVAVRKAQELAQYRAADGIIAITAEDDRILAEVCPKVPRYLLPLVIRSRERKQNSRGMNLLFVGGFKHLPNLDGLKWFIAEAWPIIQAKHPEVTLTVVGSSPTAEVQALGARDGIKIAGFVPDTGPYLDQAVVSIAPLRYGGGMKGKVAEALAAGVPVVTTSVGAQGMEAVSGEHLLIGDTGETFATGVLKLLEDQNLQERLSAQGQLIIESICGPTAISLKLSGMLRKVVTQEKPKLALTWKMRACGFKLRQMIRG